MSVRPIASSREIDYARGRYCGELEGGNPHGHGSWRNDIGNSYEGMWVKGRFHGFGVCKVEGASYRGEFQNCEPHGRGRWMDDSGNSYEGEFQYGKYHGSGIRKQGSSYYEGEWREGKRHGVGTYVEVGCVERMEWQNDMRHGFGTSTYDNEPGYEGVWVRNWPSTHLNDPSILTFDNNNINELCSRYPTPDQLLSRGVILQSKSDPNRAFHPAEKQCAALSRALAIRGIAAQTIYFSSSSNLKEQIRSLTGNYAIVWLRAHGSVLSFDCGKNFLFFQDRGDETTLSSIPLNENATFVLESCDTGRPNGLAEKLKDIYRDKHIQVIAPNGTAMRRGFSVADGRVLFISRQGNNITTIYR